MRSFVFDWSLFIVAMFGVILIPDLPPGTGLLMFMVATADGRRRRAVA